MLCAQHALNALLQGHYFDASQLADTATDLATYERETLGLDTQDEDTAKHMDDTGYFSIEVLSRALEAWGLRLVRWRSAGALQERYAHPEREFAFVLHLGSHWLTVRGFGHKHRVW